MGEDKHSFNCNIDDIFDPTKKIYDPFGEYKGHDFEAEQPEKPKDHLTRKIEEYSYFKNSRAIEFIDPKTGKYVKYTGKTLPAPCQQEDIHGPEPEIKDKQYL